MMHRKTSFMQLFGLLLVLLLSRTSLGKKSAAEVLKFKKKVEAVYKRVAPCLQLSETLNVQQPVYIDDLEDHYKEVLAVTAQFRGLPPHNGSYYPGPWIENLFIRDFVGKPFAYFQGIIPLFVQWSDYHLHNKNIINPATKSLYTEEEIFQSVSDVLRKNVLYMIISQANYGIEFLMTKHPNVLIFSAGGEGDVPIPLIKGELPFSPLDALSAPFPKYTVGFYGSVNHGHRAKMLDRLQFLLDASKTTYRLGPSKTWVEDMSFTMLNLAPMGMGRASFRLAEIIQLGRIPVYLYEDFPWCPYAGTGYGPGDLGFLIKSDDMESVLSIVTSATNATIEAKMASVKKARSMYTYAGLLNQIDKWFRDPFGPKGGMLRCMVNKNGKHKSTLLAAAISPFS